MRLLLSFFLGLSFALTSPTSTIPAFAGALHSPGKGSPLRGSILDTARPAFEQATGGPVEFVVTTLNVMGQWAYGDVQLQRPGGQPIIWAQTRFAEDYAQGMFDPAHNLFLLQQRGTGWVLVEHAVGPTDIAWDWWRQQYNIPVELFQ